MSRATPGKRRLAALLAVGVASVTVCSAADSRSTQTYVSKRYGYQITVNGTYTMIQALLQWDGGFPFGASGMVDITINSHDRKFIVAAKPVSSKTTLARWEAFVVGVQRQYCGRLRRFRASSLGGVPAREFVNTCPGYEVITLAALHKKRGYLLNYLSPTGSNAAVERRTYEVGRHGFRFLNT